MLGLTPRGEVALHKKTKLPIETRRLKAVETREGHMVLKSEEYPGPVHTNLLSAQALVSETLRSKQPFDVS
jgi:hypothetical protein